MSGPVPFLDLAPSHQLIRTELDRAWVAAVDTNAYTLGPLLERFEQDWASYLDVDHAVGVANGTDAIELILRALDIGAGDEVVVPASTFVATAAAVAAVGATPVFSDVDAASMLLTGDHLRAVLTPRTVAVIPVHLYGTVVDLDDIARVADPAAIAVIEDAAQAHGASHGDRRVGSLSRAAGFSHYPTKTLGAFGDAGSITTDDAVLAERVRRLRNHGRATQSDLDYVEVGRTSRLDAIQAAVLTAKLPHLDDWVSARRAIAGWYDELLPDGVRRVGADRSFGASPHLCVVSVPHRDRVRAELTASHIGSGVHYPDPVPRTPAFGGVSGAHPVAESAADSVLSLPVWPGLQRGQVEQVCDALESAMERVCS